MFMIVRVFLLISAVLSALLGVRLLLRSKRDDSTVMSKFTDARNGVSCILLSVLAVLILLLAGR